MAREDSEREEDTLDLAKTDFFVWDYGKLSEYQRKLISVVASLESQLDRQTMRLAHYDLIQDFKDQVQARDFADVWDERWRKSIVFNMSRARLVLAEVTRRMSVMESGVPKNISSAA